MTETKKKKKKKKNLYINKAVYVFKCIFIYFKPMKIKKCANNLLKSKISFISTE